MFHKIKKFISNKTQFQMFEDHSYFIDVQEYPKELVTKKELDLFLNKNFQNNALQKTRSQDVLRKLTIIHLILYHSPEARKLFYKNLIVELSKDDWMNENIIHPYCKFLQKITEFRSHYYQMKTINSINRSKNHQKEFSKQKYQDFISFEYLASTAILMEYLLKVLDKISFLRFDIKKENFVIENMFEMCCLQFLQLESCFKTITRKMISMLSDQVFLKVELRMLINFFSGKWNINKEKMEQVFSNKTLKNVALKIGVQFDGFQLDKNQKSSIKQFIGVDLKDKKPLTFPQKVQKMKILSQKIYSCKKESKQLQYLISKIKDSFSNQDLLDIFMFENKEPHRQNFEDSIEAYTTEESDSDI